MKKLLFTFFAIMLLGTSGAWGADPVGYYHYSKTEKEVASANSWTNNGVYTSFKIGNVTFATANNSGEVNGKYRNANEWMLYRQYSNGPLTLTADDGYWILDVAITYNTYSDGVISDKINADNAPQAGYASGATIPVNKKVMNLYVGKSTVRTTGNYGFIGCTKFAVSYCKAPTAISLSNITVSVGNEFKLSPTTTPLDAYKGCTWSSNKTDVVSVTNGGVIKALKAGSATITATSVNGKVATCTVTVSSDETIYESLKKYDGTATTAFTGTAGATNKDGENAGIKWALRDYRRAASDTICGKQGVALEKISSANNYIAYQNANIEGGVKRVAFQWRALDGTKAVKFQVDGTQSAEPKYATSLAANVAYTEPQFYTKDVNMQKNYQFRITLTDANASQIVFGPLTITPYLLYKTKTVSAADGFYHHADLINNTGSALSNAMISVNNTTAAEVLANGDIKSLQDNKTVIVTAKWNTNVQTTCTLTTKLVDPAGSFAQEVVTKQIGDGKFTNEFTKTVGDTYTFVSTNTNVATVDPTTGEVTIVNGGTTQIKAVFAVSAPYKAKEFAYTLDVTHTPTEPYFAESFDSIPVGTNIQYNDPKVFGGNGGVYRWMLDNTQRIAGENIGTYVCPKLMNNYGKIAMADVAEGGIKEVAFRYRAKGTTLPIHFYVKVGDKVVEMQRPKSSATFNFAHQFNMADSVGLSIYLGATETPTQQTHILLDTVKIVPYLLYTQKVVAASAADGAYTNLNLINNTGVKPSYSISCSDEVATIDENGAVTIKQSDTVTVTATWGKVKTTYTLQMQAKQIPEIKFAEESPNKDLLAGEFTNALTTPAGVGDTTYTSSNEDVATVDAKTGKVTMRSIGQTTITATIAENTTYAATSKSYDLTVGFTPTAGTFWTETFSAIPVKDGYTNKDTTVIGDAGVYNWSLSNFAHRSGDLVGNQKNYYGICKSENGYIKTNNMEGGVKCISFDWSPKNDKRAIDFSVKVGETSYEYIAPGSPAGQIYRYARLTNANQNVNLEFKLENFVDVDHSAYIVFGKMMVVPYLLYTDKKETINLADYQSATYTNDKLINNTGVIVQAGQTDIEFSVVGQSAETDKIATVNKETGVVTPVGGGTIKIQAKWGEVTTTYELTINKMDYTPAFAETTVPKTMNDSVFTIALNDVPEDATGARTYSSTNERVAKVNNEGKVTVYGPGTTDIKVEIAENAKYKKQSTKFTLTVTEPTTDTDITEGFIGKQWGVSDTSLVGDLCTWKTYQTRRTNEYDSLKSKGVKMGAEWMEGEKALGYLESDGAVEGGVKRIYFTWLKNAIKSPGTGDPTFMVKVGDVEDVFNAKDSTQSKEHVYLHNFNVRENSVIKIYNNSWSNFKAGPIVITPYIYYLKKNVTIKASEYVYPEVYAQTLLNNTNGVGKITYESDNTDAAEVLENGNVKVKAAAENPVTITAKWQPDENVEKYVTTSYKLFISAKKQREAEFDEEEVEVVRGVTPVNELDLKAPKGDSDPVIEYESSDTQVAVIGENNVVVTVGPGKTTITAHIGETNKCLAQDVSYALTVTYAPADGTYFTETFSQAVASGYKQGPETITGSYGFYQWGLKRYRRNTTTDLVDGVQGTRICYDEDKSDAYIATVGAQEGGLKEVVFGYMVPGQADLPIHFFVQAGDSTHEYYHVPITDKTAVTPYAHDFSEKSNTTLSIYMNKKEATPQSAITVSPVKIIPYLLYTRKDTTIYAKDLADKNFKFFNNKWYNNTNNEGTISYTVLPKDNAVEMDGDSVKIIGEGTDTIQASWEGVTTTYVIHVVLETPVLSFDDQEVNKKVSESPYTQEVNLTTPATGTIVYSIVDDPEGASIDSETGEVTMTAAGVYTIKATFPQQLPYKQGEATYKLTVTEKTSPQIKFTYDNMNKDLLDAAFIDTLNAPEGIGAVTYKSSDEQVATVDANGLVSMKTVGSITITAYSEESDDFAADSAKFTLNISYSPVAGKSWRETFSKRNPQSSKDLTPRPTVGDSAIYNWTLTNYDYNNSDNIDGVIGVRVRYDGSIVCDAMEGGIKAASFRWRSSSNNNPIHFTVKADNEPVVVEHAIIPKGDPVEFPFVRKFAKTSNASFSIKVDTAGQPALAYIGCGPITITPYLLFKKFDSKEVTLDLDQVTEFKLNDTIINNTEGGTITFAIDSFKTDVTPVIENGKITFDGITKGGKVYVSAKWEDVVTTLVINTTIKPQISFAVPAPADQNLIDGSYTNALNKPEGAGAVTYTSSNKQVATVDNSGVVTFLVAGTTTIKAKVAASDIYNADSLTYTLNIKGYTPAKGEAWVETFSRLSPTGYVTTEAKFQGDSAVYGWRINDYTRDSKETPFRLRAKGYIATNGRLEGGIKYAALNWKPAANGNIDFTMKVNNKSYQYSGTVDKTKNYRFEHFFNADSVCPLEIKMASEGITANMSVVDVTVVPYLLYTKKTASIKIGETYTNENLINNLEGADKASVQYAIVEGSEYATIEGNVVTGIKATPANKTVKVKAYLNNKLYTTYTLTITADSEITLDENADNSVKIAGYAGQTVKVKLVRSLTAGMYNTFCLPFTIEKDELEEALDTKITSLATLVENTETTADLDDIKKNLSVTIEAVTEMQAGKPYLINPADDVTNPVFKEVTIENAEETSISGSGVTFYGIVSPHTILATDQTTLFLVSGNRLAWNNTGKDSDLKGLRAYFDVPGMSTAGVSPRLVMRQPNTPTELMNVNVNVNANVNKVLINDQIYIIRNGVYYNLNGQIAK